MAIINHYKIHGALMMRMRKKTFIKINKKYFNQMMVYLEKPKFNNNNKINQAKKKIIFKQ